jgi:hypothetical protein
MKQGSTELVIASSGLATIEAGGSLDVESGGGIDVQSGGDITVESGGAIVWPVSDCTSSVAGSTALAAFANSGISFVCSSADERKFEIGTPYPGAVKVLFETVPSLGSVHYYSVTTDAGILTTAAASTAHLLIAEATTATGKAGWAMLFGLSTSRWILGPHSPDTGWVLASTSS